MFVLATNVPTSPPFDYTYWGFWVAIASVIVSVVLVVLVSGLDWRRRNEQKEHFEKLIISNVDEISKIYNSVTVLSHREKYTPEELEEKTRELHNFFKRNKENILTLIRDTKFYSSMLSVIEAPSVDMNRIVEMLRWLTDEFYILDGSIERNMRHWIGKEKQLQDNGDYINSALSALNKH